MQLRPQIACAALVCAGVSAIGGGQSLTVPGSVTAGEALQISTGGTGKAQVTIIGPAQVIRRDVDAGEPAVFSAGVLTNAGHYLVLLTAGGSTVQTGALDVLPARAPATISFLAKPSRLPVGVHDGISGAAYLFDIYGNLVLAPTPVTFALSTQPGVEQTRTVTSRDGVAWTQMDSSPKEGAARFVARSNDVSSIRIIQQVPGEPCSLHLNVHSAGGKVDLTTDPVHDCKGNAVPDGTIVTFTETYGNEETTADVPLKRGIARIEMPDHPGARITVASGIVLGNEVHL